MKICKEREKGIATLEMAIFSLVILLLLSGGFALTGLMQRTYRVGYSVDKYLHDDSMRPFLADSNVEGVVLRVARQKISDRLLQIARKIENDLFSNTPSDQYLVEAAYSIVQIDPSSGQIGQMEIVPTTLLGSLRLPAEMEQRTNLARYFEYEKLQNIVSQQTFSSLAVPLADLGTGLPEFMDQAVLLGIRAFRSLENDFSGQVYASFGGEPFAYSVKVVTLRSLLQ